MKRDTTIIGIAICLMLAASTQAQSHIAADMYRIAAQAVTKPSSDAQRFILIDVIDAPLDESAKAYVAANAKALDDFDSASQLPFGDWGWDQNDVLYAGKTLDNASDLANVVVLHARLRAADKKYGDAFNDCYELALLARRLSVQPSLTREILQQKLFDQALSAAGLLLLDAPADDIQKFLAHLDELRRPSDPIDVTLAQQQVYLWFYGKIVDDPSVRGKLEAVLGPVGNVLGLKSGPVDVGDLVADPIVAQEVFADTETAFQQLVEALKSPAADRGAAVQSLVRRLHSSHALVRGAGEMALRSYQLSQMQIVQEQLLRTAAKICTELPRPINDEAAKMLAGNFEYNHVSGGFELVGSYDTGDQPIAIRVGVRPIRPPTTMPAQRSH